MGEKGVKVSKEVTVAKKRDQQGCTLGGEPKFGYLTDERLHET